jgi:dTDP-4-dehydrorhamnose reductase
VKVLLTGGSGQLGRAIVAATPPGATVLAPRSTELDLRRPGDAERLVRIARPDLVINAAAYTLVDRAEDEPDEAFAINDRGAAAVAKGATAAGARLIHVSTDFVFGGGAAAPYAPDAPTGPLGVYGRSKRAGELEVLQATAGRAAVVRTAWLYDAVGRNFFTTMLRLFRERGGASVVADQTGTPTAAASLAAALWRLAERPTVAGVHHWTDGGRATWHEFAVAIERMAREVGLLQAPVSVRPIATAEYPTRARRPAYSVLDLAATSRALDLRPRPWTDALGEVVAERAAFEAAATSTRSAPE